MRVCECGCGVEFTPRKSTGRFASTACRVRANRARKRAEADGELVAAANVVSLAGRRKGTIVAAGGTTATGGSTAPADPGRTAIAAAVTRELGEAIDTSLGQQALALARRMDSNIDASGASLATMSKQLVVLTAAALQNHAPALEEDPVAKIQAQVIALRQAHAPGA